MRKKISESFVLILYCTLQLNTFMIVIQFCKIFVMSNNYKYKHKDQHLYTHYQG